MTENSSTVLVGEIHLHCAGFWTWKSSPSHRLLFHFSLLLSGGTPQAIVWWFTNEPPVVRCACGCEPHQCAAERGGGGILHQKHLLGSLVCRSPMPHPSLPRHQPPLSQTDRPPSVWHIAYQRTTEIRNKKGRKEQPMHLTACVF